jgi:hypothetical protein
MENVVEVDADQLSSGDAITLISSAIAGLNAEDIESFQILKDGSATSIYLLMVLSLSRQNEVFAVRMQE